MNAHRGRTELNAVSLRFGTFYDFSLPQLTAGCCYRMRTVSLMPLASVAIFHGDNGIPVTRQKANPSFTLLKKIISNKNDILVRVICRPPSQSMIYFWPRFSCVVCLHSVLTNMSHIVDEFVISSEVKVNEWHVRFIFTLDYAFTSVHFYSSSSSTFDFFPLPN